MRDLYIYYKVPAHQAASLWPRVQALQAELAVRHGIHAQLRRRPEARDGLQTWMEIYPDAPDGIEALIDGAFAASSIVIDSPRHTEVFTDDSPCA